MTGPWVFPLFAALLLEIAFPRVASPAGSFASLAGMARLEAEDHLDAFGASSLLDGYLAFGLGREAVSSLERRIRMGEVPRAAAASLFERIVAGRGVREDPAQVVAVCETAARNGVDSPLLSFSCGNALRMTGRFAEAAEVLAGIGPDHPYRPHALFALGQISVERGDFGNGREFFRSAAEAGRSIPGLSRSLRAARAEAGLLILMGRAAEASRLLEELPRGDADFAERVGAASASGDPSSALEDLPAEWISDQPVRGKILFLLLKGGIARDQGRFASAIADLSAADAELEASRSRDSLPPSRLSHRNGIASPIGRLVETQESSRERLVSRGHRESEEVVRDRAVELLVGLLVLEQYAVHATAAVPAGGLPPRPAATAAPEVVSILQRIERIALEGMEQTITALKWDSVFWDVDRFASQLDDRIADLPPLGHPVQRQRLLARIERRQAELHRSRERLRQRREGPAGRVESDIRAALPDVLRDFGLYLKELDGLRAAMADARQFTRANARKLRQGNRVEESSRKAMEALAGDALAVASDRMKALLPSLRTLEDRARAVHLERENRELEALRPLIRRQLADACVAQARSLLREPGSDAQREFWTAVGKAAALLESGDLARPDRLDTAINIGSLLAGRMGRRAPLAGGDVGDREKHLIPSVLPVLEAAGRTESRREESLYLIAILRMISGDEAAHASARSFLERFPESPMAADIAVRLGHEALASGDATRAEGFYRAATVGGNPAASAIARHMRGWIRYRNGDSAAALEELGTLVADPTFSCGDPGPFEQDVLSLTVRAMRDAPPEELAAFPPVREGTCGGRRLLLLLGESEAERDAIRASQAYDALSRRYPDDESAPSFEKKAIEGLVRAGRDREAMSRALSLREKYGAGSAWASSRSPAAREKAASDLAGVLQTLSDRMFTEGIRTGNRTAMSLAAAGFERYVDLSNKAPGESDGEMRLKWATACLRTGEREAATGLLLELMGEGRSDDIGERAAILYAETMIAGYERNEQDAEDAETATYLLLGDDPSERAAALAVRAASDFLGAKEYERAAGIAEEIDASASAPNGLKARALLIRAESSYFRGETAAALRQAESVLGHAGAAASPELLLRAKELYLLAAHKGIEGKMAARDWYGAGEMLERVGERFADGQEAPLYYLNALRSYRQAGREDAALRAGLHFLAEFPGREESVEIVGTVGPYLQARREFARAADLYENVAERFPRNPRAPRFLFHAARLSEFVGDREKAATRYSACRSRYADPRWVSAYAALAIGAMKRADGDAKTAIRDMEEGVRLVKAGLEPDAPVEMLEMAGKARIAIGESWAEQFRKAHLVLPLERSLAVKERFFRQALAAFEAAGIDASLEVALQASRLSADLLVEFGKSILESQRPKGMGREERARYEEALKRRARDLFERAFARYAEAFDLLAKEQGTPDLAAPIRDRLEEVQALLSKVPAAKEASP